MNVVSVVGARPQFVKAAMISLALRDHKDVREILVHTGQHYDDELSQVFFEQLDLPPPTYHLGVGSGRHGQQTGQMIEGIEGVLLKEKPDVVLVYGDTNSTLAGALAAVKLGFPVAHVEAGLRSGNLRAPEEINRIVTDRVSTYLFCPSDTALRNLAQEGIRSGTARPRTPGSRLVVDIGDVMYDALLRYLPLAEGRPRPIAGFAVTAGGYFLATVHRAENTDDPDRLRGIMAGLREVDATLGPVLLPLHPRTRHRLADVDGVDLGGIRVVPPLSYLDTLAVARRARAVLTDSGGLQREAYWLGVPCVTLRDETEWLETVEAGWNRLVGADPQRILDAATDPPTGPTHPPLYGDGLAAPRVVARLAADLS